MDKDKKTVIKNTVRVRVLDITHRGLDVIIEDDNRIGFIRRQEISWNRSSRNPTKLPRIGDDFRAVIVSEEPRLLLSRRQVSDPWTGDGIKKYVEGQTFEAEVVNVLYHEAYVQLEPGVDALLSETQVPLLRYQKVNDNVVEGEPINKVLKVGDRVSVKIIRADLKGKRIEVSIVSRIRQVASLESRVSVLQNYFGISRLQRPVPSLAPMILRQYDLALPVIEGFLVIDDELEEGKKIESWLGKNYPEPVDVVSNAQEAENLIRQGNFYSLVIVDRNLAGMDGEKVARGLHSLGSDLQFLLTSSVNLVDTGGTQGDYPFCLKEESALVRAVGEVLSGNWGLEHQEASPQPNKIPKREYFLRQMGIQALARRSLEHNLSVLLAQLAEITKVSYALMVEVKLDDRSGTIISCSTKLEHHLKKQLESGLFYSPVQEIVREAVESRATYIHKRDRFQNFFNLLEPQSYLGLPVNIPGFTLQHVLILLDKDAETFHERETTRTFHAYLASYFLASAIERDRMLGYMQEFDEKYAVGQLIFDLNHETKNKLVVLDTQINRLENELHRLPADAESEQVHVWHQNALDALAAIRTAQEDLSELMHAYERHAAREEEVVDIAQLLAGIERQTRNQAKRENITILIDVDSNIPPLKVIGSRLQQVVLNLVLNAIQMTRLHCEKLDLIARQYERRPDIHIGSIILQARYDPDAPVLPLQIRVIDSGPGVHWQEREIIFRPGMTTRENGAGMGLFISRNLIEWMGGRLTLLDSILFLGSVFLIELPVSPKAVEAQ